MMDTQFHRIGDNKHVISVRIIIPTKDVGPYIYACLSSCIDGASTNATIYIIDGGSTDTTLSEVARFKHDYPDHSVVVSHDACQGAGQNRNAALARATEDFVAFVDGDDLISRKALDTICAQMRTHNAEVAAPITQLFDDYGRYSDVFDDGVGRLLNGRRLIVTESRSSPEVLDFETSMCMRVFSRPFLRGSSIQFGTESFCEDVLPSRIAFLRASRIVVSNESYYFYRKNRRGQRTHFLCPTNGRIADVIRDCMHVGMEFITDDRQGGYFLLRLLRLVFWSRELIPLELADALQTRLVQEFRRSPSGWWRALRAMPECNRRMKRFADLNLVGAREQLLAKVFDTTPTPFADRVARKMMRRI